MKLVKILPIMILLLACAFVSFACSKAKSPVSPVNEPADQSFGAEMDERNLIAVYDAVIDPDAGTFEITPVEREGTYHFPLTQSYPNVLQITGYGFTPEFWADIKLQHPYPGSGIVGFDPRVIAILPANTGNQIYFPTFNVHANNAIVFGANGYTKMYDTLAPAIPGNANPYKSYFTQIPYHAWMSTGMTEDTRTWYMDLAGFGGPISYKLVVDVSTNFPNPPAPVTDNAPEPVGLMLEIGDGLNPAGGNATVTATLRDWQGEAGIRCKVEAPALFAGSVELFYTEPGPLPNEYVFEGTISNDLNAPMGEYGVLLAAWDTTLGNHNFKIASAYVGGAFNLEDITSPISVFSPRETIIAGDYAYSAGMENGFYIFSITNSTDFELIKHIDFEGECNAVQVANDFAYISIGRSGLDAGLTIVDISTPESAFVVNTVPMNECNGLDVYGNYAYLSRNHTGVSIVDITNPETADIVKNIPTSGQARDLCYSDGYVYVPVSQTIQIMDVDPPIDASVVKTLDTPSGGYAFDVDVQLDYAYFGTSYGLWVVDIFIPESATGVQLVDINYRQSCTVKGNYAYACGSDDSYNHVISVIDISTPGSAFELFDVVLDHYGEIFVTDEDIAFVSNGEYGLTIVDVDPLGSQDVIETYYSTLYSYASDAYGDYVYTVIRSDDYFSRLVILNVANPESATVVGGMLLPGDENYQVSDIQVDGNYAYIAKDEDGLYIVDVTNPALPELVHAVTYEYPGYLTISGEYAYVTADYMFYVVDISTPESAFYVTGISGLSSLREIAVSGNFAYIADRDGELHIIDISNPEFPDLRNSVTLPQYPSKIDVANGYAYVAGNGFELHVIDVDPPETASIVGSTSGLADVGALEIYSHYLFMGDNDDDRFLVYDLTYPESPFFVDSLPIGEYNYCVDIHAHDGIAYLAGEDGLIMINLH